MKNKKVYVALSGGVDSSVAAALLKKQGYNVIGVFFKPWQPKDGLSFCNWKKDRQDALKVAVKLEIPFLTWDFSDEYYKKVTKYMIDSYRKGITPNPDVMCNKEIKFGIFLDRALKEGADLIATGHYAQIKKNKNNFELLKGKDKNKDQSYFLYTLNQKQLKHILFPIGNLIKQDVRKLAKKFNLPNYNKKDSQGVCFVGDLDMKEFLKSQIKSKIGVVKNPKGEVIGEHDGAQYFTIGERHGFRINKDNSTYFIYKKDVKKNILYVSKKKLKNNSLILENVSWINKSPKLPFNGEVKIRYRQDSQKIKVIKNRLTKSVKLEFKKPQESITSGQSAIIYDKEKVLGGGIIK